MPLTCFKKKKKIKKNKKKIGCHQVYFWDIFSTNFLRTFNDFVHFWEKLNIKQTSNVKRFFELQEDV